MNLPEQPPSFRPAGPGERPWWWRLEDAAGAEVSASEEYAGQQFSSQADAESWVGEIWSELAEEGVASVTLFDGERRVYGPMSLTA